MDGPDNTHHASMVYNILVRRCRHPSSARGSRVRSTTAGCDHANHPGFLVPSNPPVVLSTIGETATVHHLAHMLIQPGAASTFA
jgi:hypothetical protein